MERLGDDRPRCAIAQNSLDALEACSREILDPVPQRRCRPRLHRCAVDAGSTNGHHSDKFDVFVVQQAFHTTMSRPS